ncbi:MAG: flagellar basal body P-ring protein FlgI [Nitrospiraceae bacterium]|nr:flagellar basal body P-ring protein FlgI [Nitrospiraceae bacterium]
MNLHRPMTGITCGLLAAVALLASPHARATRLKDLCEVQGARPNILFGLGLVVGLAGTGDKNQAVITAQQRVLERQGIIIENIKDLAGANCAVVAVSAELPAFAKEGTRIDVSVESFHNCKSLEGGRLLETHLRGPSAKPTDPVYVIAQGPVSIGGFNTGAGGGGGASVRMNHATAGRIPRGGYVENEVPSRITDGERISLLLKRPDFTTADNIENAINAALEPASASALGAGTINVVIPEMWRRNLVSFIAFIQDIDVEADAPSRVVINEKTGTLVVGGKVLIKPCQVAHGNLTIDIRSTPLVSQPQPFSGGQTVVTEETKLEVIQEDAHLMPVEGTSAGEVAAALNKLKVTPRDLISIFQALRAAGALEADLVVM